MHIRGGGVIHNLGGGGQSTPQLPSHSQLGGTVMGGSKGGGMVGSGRLYHTTGTHNKEEGRGSTPTCQFVSTA